MGEILLTSGALVRIINSNPAYSIEHTQLHAFRCPRFFLGAPLLCWVLCSWCQLLSGKDCGLCGKTGGAMQLELLWTNGGFCHGSARLAAAAAAAHRMRRPPYPLLRLLTLCMVLVHLVV